MDASSALVGLVAAGFLSSGSWGEGLVAGRAALGEAAGFAAGAGALAVPPRLPMGAGVSMRMTSTRFLLTCCVPSLALVTVSLVTTMSLPGLLAVPSARKRMSWSFMTS